MPRPGLNDPQLDSLINGRIVEDEELDELVEQRLSELGVVPMAIGIGALILAIREVYRNFLAKDRACIKFESQVNTEESIAYRRCKIYYKIMALKKAFETAERKQLKCKYARDPEKCKNKIEEVKQEYVKRAIELKNEDNGLYKAAKFYARERQKKGAKV